MKVLFVCMGNICRSPSAHGIFRDMVAKAGWSDRIQVDSAGTENWHQGKAPDSRSQTHAQQRGYDISDLRAMQLRPEHLHDFDLVLVMDADNLAKAHRIAPTGTEHKLRYFSDFCQHSPAGSQVPDPYYGGADGFEQVLDMLEDGCTGLLAHCQTQQPER